MGHKESDAGVQPSGSRSTQGMSGISEEGDRHTKKIAWKKKLLLFLGQFSFYGMNITPPPPLKSPHIPSDIAFMLLSIFFFPMFSPYAFIWNISDYRIVFFFFFP